ncbi:hypothetical protein [Moorena sp. SIO3H5]|uniref:hypothetical protein n=1 Tax=Moorena sp. SIO3H5 TaxID=2607834 RepID=UPI0025D77E87|nr:hypothetical protein [Moorena sp. SIO3H5]
MSYSSVYSVYRSYEVQSSLILIPCLDPAHRYSLFPVPCSLKFRNCVPHSYDNCYICDWGYAIAYPVC